jgi:hypothetical protein
VGNSSTNLEEKPKAKISHLEPPKTSVCKELKPNPTIHAR